MKQHKQLWDVQSMMRTVKDENLSFYLDFLSKKEHIPVPN